MEALKKNWQLVLIGLGTVVLGVVAVVTAVKLYQTSQEPIAPTAPLPVPAAEPTQTLVPAGESSPCSLSFCIQGEGTPTPTPTITVTPTPTPTGTITPTPTGTITPTPTPIPDCWELCSDGSDCQGDLTCQLTDGVKRCVNPQCDSESDCVCNRQCWEVCGHDNECPSGLSCRQIDETKRCVNSSCERESDCDCSFKTTSPTPSVPQVKLPEAGIALPTIGAVIGSILLVITSFLLLL